MLHGRESEIDTAFKGLSSEIGTDNRLETEYYRIEGIYKECSICEFRETIGWWYEGATVGYVMGEGGQVQKGNG